MYLMRLISQINLVPEKTFYTKVLWLLVMAYFTYHLVQGERGGLAMLRLQTELSHASTQLAELKTTRINMEKHVQLLRPNQIDRDMLDEQARATLGYGRPGETVILLPQTGDSQDDASTQAQR